MTTVHCAYEECIYNQDTECTKDEIYLDDSVEDILVGCPDAESEAEE